MMISSDDLYRAASLSALVALIALIGAAITLALFFGGAGQFWGPVNDVLFAIMLVALILPILAIDRLTINEAGFWVRVVTVAALAGAVVGAVGQLLLVVNVIDLNTSYVTGGVGIVPVLVWIAAVAVLGGPMGLLPAQVGLLAGITLGLVVVGSVVTAITQTPIIALPWVAVTIALVVWLGSLSGGLAARAA
jgi:hypothetical protein